MLQTDSQKTLENVSRGYEGILRTLGNGATDNDSPVNLRSINEKLLHAVGQEISATTSEIKTVASEGFQQSKQAFADTSSIPDYLVSELADLPNVLGIPIFEEMGNQILKVLQSFQAIVEDPSSIFPRLQCGDIPIDPALITSFRKRHQKLERQYEVDPELQNRERSLPNAPKTGLDVITNVTSSLESISDNVLASVQKITAISKDVEELREAALSLKPAAEPIGAVAEHQRTIQDLISRVSTMFRAETTEIQGRSVDIASVNPLNLAQEASIVVKKVTETSEELGGLMEKVEKIGDVFSSFITKLKKFLSQAAELLASFIDNLNALRSNLPRIVRELQQFFMPTGLKVFLLKPSDLLLEITESIDALKMQLSEPEVKARSAVDAMKEGVIAKKVEDIKSTVPSILSTPQKLIDIISKQDIEKTITETLQRIISEILAEVGSSALGGVVGGVLESVGQGDLLDDVSDKLGFLTGRTEDETENVDGPPNAGLLENIVSMPWGRSQFFG